MEDDHLLAVCVRGGRQKKDFSDRMCKFELDTAHGHLLTSMEVRTRKWKMIMY